MADNADSSGDAQITFKVKTSGDSTHTITMAESATVQELKNKLAGDDYEKIPAERQRLIYSGRVLKNDDTLATYKIKPNNTIHMVKSAASNPSQTPSTGTPVPQAVPSNMASGTANNPLAGLTGARFAGHQMNLPGMDMFGPDGGMGPPMDEERLQRMMEDPNVQQSMNEALSNPDFVNMLIQSNPMLRNLPNAREIITSPFMRQMMTNPSMMSQAMRMQRSMSGGNPAFPAPGATDTTPSGAPSSNEQGQQQQNPFSNPFVPFGGMGGAGANAMPDPAQMAQQLQSLQSLMGGLGGSSGAGNAGDATSTSTSGVDATQQQQQQQQGNQAAANPFAALFGPPGGGLGGMGGAGGGQANNPFGMTPEMMQQMMQMMGGAGGATQSPPDNRPPEERYEDQLRQLNDMGFFDFDRNVAALRRSGGSVQGAVEYLLSN
ncbi:ubiquilin [Geosmithia morbida]|uniref:Ubiquilin n=1 Tax=Geosmithia morbida TaxID=1094350 RepID=A0A9P5D6R3_9HYPO|nr:ubiquilin [Geosmithia morbida]KAF4125030.1 ubiquilin [Geosmithia morbida]